MKKLLILITIFFVPTFGFGQDLKELKGKYFIDMDKFLSGQGVVELNEYSNYEARLKYNDLNKNKKWEEADKYENEAYQSTIFRPEKGSYFLSNEDQNFWFTVNEKGQFDGIGKAKLAVNGTIEEKFLFNFKEGKSLKTEVRNIDDVLLRILERNDTTFVISWFDKGKLNKKFIWKKNSEFPAMNIYYYENGNMKSETNQIDKTLKTFYENGNPEKFENEKTKEIIDYDEQGRKARHFYVKSTKESCEEWFKNGELDYYVVKNNINGELKTYNKKNKLIKTEKVDYTETKVAN